METLKNILRPGNAVDDEILYGQKAGDSVKTNHRHTKHGIIGEGGHLAEANEGTTESGQVQSSHEASSVSKGDDISQPGGSQYPINTGVDSSNKPLASTTSASDPSESVSKPDSQVDTDKSRVTGNETLGSTAAGGSEDKSSSGRAFFLTPPAKGTNDEHREYDPEGVASSRGITTAHGETYETKKATTVGPNSSSVAHNADTGAESNISKARDSGIAGVTGGYKSSSGGSYHTGPTGSAVGDLHQTTAASKPDPSVDGNKNASEDAVRPHEKDRTVGGESAAIDSSDKTDSKVSASALGLGAVGAVGAGSLASKSQSTDHAVADTSREAPSSSLTDNEPSMPGAYPTSSASSAIGTTSQSYTGLPDRTRTSDKPTSTTTGEKEHHYGRDAAIAGGAAGLAGVAYGASKHSDEKATSEPHTSDTLTKADPSIESKRSEGAYGANPVERSHDVMTGSTTGQTSGPTTTTGPHSSDLANKADPRVDSDRSKESHHGRDAALGAGALGAAGAAYGATHRDSDLQTSSSGKTAGPHSSDLANKLDPRVDSDLSKQSHPGKDTAISSGAVGTATYVASEHHDNKPESSVTQTTTGPQSSDLAQKTEPTIGSDPSKESHYGRDAAIGAGAVGATGAAVYGASKHHEDKPESYSKPQSSFTQTTTGSTSSDPAKKLEPELDSDRNKESHHGKDVAIGAGAVGATGAAAAVASKHHDDRAQDTSGTSTTTATTTNQSTATSGPHKSDLANKIDPRVDSDRSKEKDSHLGRDAAVVGGVGAAAYGAHKYDEHNDKELQEAEKRAEKQRIEDEKQAQKDREQAEKEHEKQVKEAKKQEAKEEKRAEKEHEKQVLAIQKQEAKEEKRAEKEHEKQVREAEKQEAKEQKRAEKEHEKELLAIKKQEAKEEKRAEKEHEKELREKEKQEAKEEERAEKEHEKELLAVKKQEAEEEKLAEKEQEKQLRENEKQEAKEEERSEKKEHRGFFSFLHRDKSKKYSKEEEDEFDRQEREHNTRTAAAGTAAGVGAGTYAAHEAHEDHKTHEKDQTSAEESSGGLSLGDKLHGVERSRGVAGPTGFPHGGEPHSSNVVETAIPGTEERLASIGGDHNTDQDGNFIGSSENLAGTHASHPTGDESTAQTSNAPGITGSHGQSAGDHNTSQPGNVIGGSDTTAGKTGVLGQEHGSGPAGEQHFGGTPDQGVDTEDLTKGSGHRERNRLHKDPPQR